MARLTPDELMERADEIGRLGALDAHGFFGGHISEGHAVRVVFRKGRRFDDLILFQRDEGGRAGIGAPPGGEFRVLAEWTFPILSEWGPVVVQDRMLPTVMADPVGWVTAAITNLEIPNIGDNDQPALLMDEDRFWSFIDLLGGSLEHESIARLSEELQALPQADLVAFRDTLVARLHELDHPLNTVGSGAGAERVVSADASLYYRCEIVAAGRASFEDYVAHPRPGEGFAGADGEALLGIAEDASDIAMADAEVSIETGTNTEHWFEAPQPQDAPTLTVPSPGPFSYDLQMTRLGLAPWLALDHFLWVAYATTPGGTVRELMGCVAQGTNAAARKEVTAHVRSLLRDGEKAHPNIVVYRTGWDGVSVGRELSGVSRRSRSSMEDYIERYYIGAAG